MRFTLLSLCIGLATLTGCFLPPEGAGPRLFFIDAEGSLAAYDPSTETTETIVSRDSVGASIVAFRWLKSGQLQLVLPGEVVNLWVPLRGIPSASAMPVYQGGYVDRFDDRLPFEDAFDLWLRHYLDEAPVFERPPLATTGSMDSLFISNPGDTSFLRNAGRSGQAVCATTTDGQQRCVPIGGPRIRLQAGRSGVAIIQTHGVYDAWRTYLLDREGVFHRLPFPTEGFLPNRFLWEPVAGWVSPLYEAHPLRGTWEGTVAQTNLQTGDETTAPLRMTFTDEGHLFSLDGVEIGGLAGDALRSTTPSNQYIYRDRIEVEAAAYGDEQATLRIVYEFSARVGGSQDIGLTERQIAFSRDGDRLRWSERRTLTQVRTGIFAADQTDTVTVTEFMLEGELARVP